MNFKHLLLVTVIATTITLAGAATISLADTSNDDEITYDDIEGVDSEEDLEDLDNLSVEDIEVSDEDTGIDLEGIGISLEDRSVNLSELADFAGIDGASETLEGSDLEDIDADGADEDADAGGLNEEEQNHAETGLCAAGVNGDESIDRDDKETTAEKNQDRDINRLPIQDQVEDCTNE